MKRLSMISLLGFAFATALSQNMYPKKITLELDPFTNILTHYSYDENMQLQAIHTVNGWGDTIVTKLYEDERLVMQYGPGLTYQLEYAADTVYEYRKQPDDTFVLSFVYVINSIHQVVQEILVDITNGNYVASQFCQWSAGNCTTITLGGTAVGGWAYDADVLNPMYNENKYFRRGAGGSLNQYILEEYYDVENELTIISTLNGYPAEILVSPTGGDDRTLYFEYHETSGADGQAFTGAYAILDRTYYLLTGQEIEQPEQGFYIERLITDRGVISFKRYAGPR